ncbi:MAG: hypothetical protein ACFB8W_17005 [Elainellaceae cyanobacterium]
MTAEALLEKFLPAKDTNSSLEQKQILALLVYLEANRGTLERSLHLELAQLYLGYLAREHTAQVGEKAEMKQSNPSATSNKSSRSDAGSKQPNRPSRR